MLDGGDLTQRCSSTADALANQFTVLKDEGRRYEQIFKA
jgi:hypothetical protein